MKKSALLATALGLALLGSTTGAAATQSGSGSAPSWNEFKQGTYKDVDGQYIVDGDIPVRGNTALREFYKKVTAVPAPGDLIANTDSYGNVKLWTAAEAKSLTYCVSDRFGSKKATVVSAMKGGTALWMNASSGVRFTYLPSNDANCNTWNNNVTFSVEPVTGATYIARSFFPGDPKSSRNILVSDTLTTSGWAPSNILGHELGHILGFRHEHTRPEAGKCFENNNWKALTPYDKVSIMHYPQCNGASKDLSFSPLDRQGVQSAYGY